MTPPCVLITESLSPGPLDWLGAHCRIEHGEPTPDRLAQADALIVRTYTLVNEALLDQSPKLRVVARAGVGLDNIDLDACKARNIPVVHTPDANTQAVVEYVATMMLASLRPIDRLIEPLPPEQWSSRRQSAVTARSCVNTPLGIIGLGRIGSRVARVGSALGMPVSYHDVCEIDESQRYGADPVELATLASRCEVISVHVDVRPTNHHLLGRAFFSMLRPDVVLINAARGFVIDTHAACDFARANPNATLVLDVHDPEPIPLDSELWGLPNVVLTPHIGAGTQAAKEAMSWVVRDVVRVLNNEPPHHPAS